jgi:outer membrane protein assembly factor BamA
MLNIKTLLVFFFNTFIVSSFSAYSQSNNSLNSQLIVRSIKIVGNNRTNIKIILRELNFRESDTLNYEQLESLIIKSKENLQNTSLFNTVNIYYQILAGVYIDFVITLEERWYFWPSLFFNQSERNFNTWWEEKDLSKLAYGGGFQIKNMRGRNENFKLDTRFGYSTRIEFAYEKIALDLAQKSYLSIYFSFQGQNQLPFITKNNKPEYLKIANNKLLYFQEVNFKYSYRPKHKISNSLELKYYSLHIADTVVLLNPNYLLNGSNTLQFFKLRYFFEYENRDYINYPIDGQYYALEFSKNGLGFIPKNPYQDFVISSTILQFKKLNDYISLGSGLYSTYSPNTVKPYAYTNGLGYKLNLRGFEYYTIEGYASILSQNQFKFTLLQPKPFAIKFIRSPKFSKSFLAAYLNIVTDIGYVWSNENLDAENNNELNNRLVYSYGLGLDFVSYYDKVLRLDLAFNSLQEMGLFINFKTSIHKP